LNSQQLFRRKSIDQLIADSENPEKRLKRTLGWLSLTSLGIGAVVGAGIFTVIGTAIAGQHFDVKSILNAPLLEYLIHHSGSFGRPGAGPEIALSFVLVAIVCGFAALCYAELAAMIPIAGSAYTYTYATMGELIAWIIGMVFYPAARRGEHSSSTLQGIAYNVGSVQRRTRKARERGP
jgi:basic amino acid/polyamine antiporter, APA family